MHSKYKNTPAIIIHEGANFYLPYVLSQLRLSNPSVPVFLIGDTSALRLAPQGVNTVNIAEYSHRADQFTELYKTQHRNYNSFNFENKCFRRTFILEEFLTQNHFISCWHIDSDNLIFSDLHDELMSFPDHCSFTSCGGSPHNSFWTLEQLADYNQYTLKCIQPDTEEYAVVDNFWNDYKTSHTVGGVCDMTFLMFYTKTHTAQYYLLDQGKNGSWNNSLYSSFPGLKRSQLFFRFADCRKENDSYWFYGKKMLNIHCQGFTKRFIPCFYTGKDKAALFVKTLRFMPRRMAAYVYHEILKF